MPQLLSRAGLKVAAPLAEFVERQVLPGLGLAPERYWADVAQIVEGFAPENRRIVRAVDQQRLVETDAVFLVTADVKLAHGVYRIGVDIVARGEGEVFR